MYHKKQNITELFLYYFDSLHYLLQNSGCIKSDDVYCSFIPKINRLSSCHFFIFFNDSRIPVKRKRP